jgi:hypothetical protein
MLISLVSKSANGQQIFIVKCCAILGRHWSQLKSDRSSSANVFCYGRKGKFCEAVQDGRLSRARIAHYEQLHSRCAFEPLRRYRIAHSPSHLQAVDRLQHVRLPPLSLLLHPLRLVIFPCRSAFRELLLDILGPHCCQLYIQQQLYSPCPAFCAF